MRRDAAKQPLDYDDDDFYANLEPDPFWPRLARVAIGVAALLLVVVAFAQSIPSAPVTGPVARDAAYGAEVVPAIKVDALVRQQDLAYLERVIASMKPNPPTFTVGKVVGLAMNPGCAGGVYVTGWVVESATRVQIRVDSATTYHEATVTPTMAGYPDTWTWCLPELYQDGKAHGLYIRAIRASGTYIGPLDNAKSAVKWSFTVPSAAVTPSPTPSPEPTPPPAFSLGRVTYAGGTVTIEAAPRFAKVELLIDSRDVSPWYQGVKTLTDGKAAFVLPAAVKDGNEHLLDVRLYDPAVPGVFRPDGYPIRATLVP